MKGSIAVLTVVALTASLTTVAFAAVPSGTYRGSLYKVDNGSKMTNAPATVKVAGKRVTISAPKFPTFCPNFDAGVGTVEITSAQYKGTIKGSKVKGEKTFRNGNFVVKMDGRFTGRKFVGDLTVNSSGATGGCGGTYTVRAKR